MKRIRGVIIPFYLIALAWGGPINMGAQDAIKFVPAPEVSPKERPERIAPVHSRSAKKERPARRSATVRNTPKPLDSSETSPLLSREVPTTGARAVMIVDARSGQVLYEKNADELRAPASTQKLLTGLIIAERGFLDQPVRVETADTM